MSVVIHWSGCYFTRESAGVGVIIHAGLLEQVLLYTGAGVIAMEWALLYT